MSVYRRSRDFPSESSGRTERRQQTLRLLPSSLVERDVPTSPFFYLQKVKRLGGVLSSQTVTGRTVTFISPSPNTPNSKLVSKRKLNSSQILRPMFSLPSHSSLPWWGTDYQDPMVLPRTSPFPLPPQWSWTSSIGRLSRRTVPTYQKLSPYRHSLGLLPLEVEWEKGGTVGGGPPPWVGLQCRVPLVTRSGTPGRRVPCLVPLFPISHSHLPSPYCRQKGTQY